MLNPERDCSWTVSLCLIVSSLLVDFTSLSIAIAILPQIGSNCGNLSDFDWIASVGLVGSALSVIATWARYAPDGCKTPLPLHLGLVLVMIVFSIPVAVYAYALDNFEKLKARNNCANHTDSFGMLFFVMLIINCYKYAAVTAVEFMIAGRHIWCYSDTSPNLNSQPILLNSQPPHQNTPHSAFPRPEI